LPDAGIARQADHNAIWYDVRVGPEGLAMQLRDLIEKYRTLAGGFGKAVPLESLGLNREETERLFSSLDEDYHISRYFHLSKLSGATAYTINGFPHSHVSIDAEIQTTL
jgi:hypothetical protein